MKGNSPPERALAQVAQHALVKVFTPAASPERSGAAFPEITKMGTAPEGTALSIRTRAVPVEGTQTASQVTIEPRRRRLDSIKDFQFLGKQAMAGAGKVAARSAPPAHRFPGKLLVKFGPQAPYFIVQRRRKQEIAGVKRHGSDG
jgi:hypothetical protein